VCSPILSVKNDAIPTATKAASGGKSVPAHEHSEMRLLHCTRNALCCEGLKVSSLRLGCPKALRVDRAAIKAAMTERTTL
jgi:hypothetical protein